MAISEDIGKAIRRITVQERIAGVISEASCAMEDVATGLRASIPAGEHATGREETSGKSDGHIYRCSKKGISILWLMTRSAV